jgi:hypothetical protein
MLGKDRQPHRQGNGAQGLPLVRHSQPGDPAAHLLGARAGLLLVGIGDDQDEFFAAIPAGNVFAADAFVQVFAESTQQRVASTVPEGVVEALEVVQVHHDQAKRAAAAVGAHQLALERLFHVAPVEKPAEWVANGLHPQLLAQLEVSQGQRQVLGQRQRQWILGFNRGGAGFGAVGLGGVPQMEQA